MDQRRPQTTGTHGDGAGPPRPHDVPAPDDREPPEAGLPPEHWGAPDDWRAHGNADDIAQDVAHDHAYDEAYDQNWPEPDWSALEEPSAPPPRPSLAARLKGLFARAPRREPELDAALDDDPDYPPLAPSLAEVPGAVFGGPGILAVKGLQKSYRGRMVVNDAGLAVRNGEAVGLLGPNGAGKTTIFYMITGLVAADRGTISLDGNDVTLMPMYRRARLGIGYLPQEASIFRGLNVEDNIRAVLEVVEPDRDRREAKLDELLEEFNIARLRKSPSIALSGGERRRCEIARALASDPSFMLLDEPFAGIDPIAVGDIQNLVRHLTKRGIGVLITDHNVRETLGLIDRAYIIHSGRVLTEGRPDEIVANREVRKLYLGEDFRL